MWLDQSVVEPPLSRRKTCKLLSDSRLEGFEIRAVVMGHRAPNGQVWNPGQRVRIYSDPHELDDTYFLMARTLRCSRGEGEITELRLREDKMWVLDAIKQKKHKGKDNSDAKLIELIRGL